MKSRITYFSVENIDSSGRRRAIVRFPRVRAEILELQSASASREIRVTKIAPLEFQIECLGNVIPSGGAIPISVRYMGEPFDNISVEWEEELESSGLEGLKANLSPKADAPRVAPFRQEALARIEAIEAEPATDFRIASIFFAEYDHQTYPPLVGVNPTLSGAERNFRLTVIPKLADIMARRVQLRGARATLGEIPSATELMAVGAATAEEVGYLSSLQLGVFRRSYGDPIDASAAGQAFEAFSNGELRFIGGIRNAEPDSAFEFSFAEFAFTAIDFGVDVSEWTALLPYLASSQRIFMEVYRPDSPSPKYGDWLASNFDASRQVDESFKESLRKSFSKLSVGAIAEKVGENAAEAFSGDYQGQIAQVNTVSRELRIAELLKAPPARPESGAEAILESTIRLRLDESKMDDNARGKFIDAFKELIDDGRFNELVNIHANMSHDMHGINMMTGDWSETGIQRFLPWHRAYLIEFENLLQSVDSTVTIPYWDWTNQAFPDWLVDFLPEGLVDVNGSSYDVFRQVGRDETLPDPAATKEGMAVHNNYTDFTLFLEGWNPYGAHNQIHVHVGGSGPDSGPMSSMYSPADPVFWLHHAECDRLWRIWQEDHSGERPDLSGNSSIMDPWNYHYDDLLDINVAPLGYAYESMNI